MTLRIVDKNIHPISFGSPARRSQGDDWASRLAKLVPAEALGLFGAGSSIVTALKADLQPIGYYILSAACLMFCVAIRFHSTKDELG
jgi:hypothetical protein